MTSVSTFIMGHFCSCNLGDKYQGYSILKQLGPSIDSVCVNFSNIDDREYINEMFFEDKIRVYSPDYAFKNIKKSNLILLTGSFDSHSPHIKYIIQAVNNPEIKSIHIWGGFHGVSGNFYTSMEWLKDSKISFHARGQDDAVVYTKMTGKDATLSGDPMCYYISVSQKSSNPVNGNIFIANYYLYKNNPKLFEYVLTLNVKTILLIDSYIDNREIFRNYMDQVKPKDCEVIHENNPLKVIDIISKHDKVYSCRLHGAVLSFGLGIPVMMIVTDGADRGTRSFKFHSVALSGNGKLCNVAITPEDLLNNTYDESMKEHTDGYIALSLDTCAKIKSELL